MTEQPAANAVEIFLAAKITGKFQGTNAGYYTNRLIVNVYSCVFKSTFNSLTVNPFCFFCIPFKNICCSINFSY
jgi:hypothetical protein